MLITHLNHYLHGVLLRRRGNFVIARILSQPIDVKDVKARKGILENFGQIRLTSEFA
jgi:hypothetical protein